MKETLATRIDFNSDGKEVKRHVYFRSLRDSMDNILEETEFGEDSKIINRWVNKYKESGELIESIKYGPEDELIEKETEVKNEYGDVVKSIVEFGDGSVLVRETIYNDSGGIEEQLITNEEGDLVGRFRYLRDSSGNIIETTETDQDGNEITKTESRYIENGDFPYEDRHYTDGMLEYIEYTKYNDQGIWTEILKCDSENKKTEHTSFEYDDLMNLTRKTIRNFADNSERVEEYVYASKYKLVLFTLKINGYLVHEKKVTYDKAGKKICDDIRETDYDGRFLSHFKCVFETRGI